MAYVCLSSRAPLVFPYQNPASTNTVWRPRVTSKSHRSGMCIRTRSSLALVFRTETEPVIFGPSPIVILGMLWLPLPVIPPMLMAAARVSCKDTIAMADTQMININAVFLATGRNSG
jgi:hypothetical protein